MPYHIGGEIAKRDSLLVATPELLTQRFRLNVRIRHEVQRVDRDAKTVSVLNHATGETRNERYDKLILAPGAFFALGCLVAVYNAIRGPQSEEQKP